MDMTKRLASLSIFGLFVLYISCTNKPVKTDEKAGGISEVEAPIEIENKSGQLLLSINGDNTKLEVLDHIKQYLPITFPEKTIIDSEEISFSAVESATIVFSDSIKYIVEIITGNGTNISVHDRMGNQLGSAEIFNNKTNSVYTHYQYFFITPNDIRIHVWNYKDNESVGERYHANIENEEYLHFNINEQGMIRKVEKPQNILDYFSILPTEYLYHHVEVYMECFPDLKDGYYWYHIYISKDISTLIDKKNGYLDLISTMVLFKANDVPYFVLTNMAGGTCETFYFHFFLTYDEKTNQFTDLSDDDIIPRIDKFDLYEQPDTVRNNFKEGNIQLQFLPPRYGTIMKLIPYIDDCGVEDYEQFGLMTQTKPMGLKWNSTIAKFEEVSLNLD